MDISRERKTIEMSEITSLNSAVSYLMKNTLELFTLTPDQAVDKSAGVWHSGNHPYMYARREGGAGGLRRCFS